MAVMCESIQSLAAKSIKLHEGFSDKPYRCTQGKLTIGYGRNLDDLGITRDEALYLLWGDIKRAIGELTVIFPGFNGFSASRRVSLIELCFAMGATKLKGFRKMRAAIAAGDWGAAASELLDSEWARVVDPVHGDNRGRADTLAKMLKEG